MPDTHEFLTTLATVLCAAGVTTYIFQRLKQPVVLGYLLAGMLIGPHVPTPWLADTHTVHTLAELGVILLMFSLGLEFSLGKLLKVGPTAGFVAIVQCSFMVWLGYLVGQAFGWSRLESFYAGAVIAISSTTIILKAYQEQGIKSDFTQIVFGILIVEDLVGILLIAVLTTLSKGGELGAGDLAMTAGKLALFLAVLIIGGLVTVPRFVRAVVALDRTETTVVANVGIAFVFAVLAVHYEYSVALGAFIAGSLVAESGVEKKVEHAVEPVRDIFAAIFFVSVGMLIDPAQIAEHWLLILVFLIAVVFGKIFSVTVGAFLTGQSNQTSIRCGMSLAQIGEFSFIIAGVGLATKATGELLYSLAVAVSAITTLITPWLIRAAEPTAEYVDRKLPRSLQTFAALYGSWVEQLGSGSGNGHASEARGRLRWLAVDAAIVAAIVIGTSVQFTWMTELAEARFGLAERPAKWLIVVAATAVAAPFWIGLIRVARYVGFDWANRVFPHADGGKADLAAAPRRLLVVTLQLAIVVLIGVPLVAITQPFLPPLPGPLVLLALLLVLAIAFWRGATNLQGHTRAAAQAIVEALAHQTQKGREENLDRSLVGINKMMSGLGEPVPIRLADENPAVGKTLAQLKLRGLTGATVLAIRRGDKSVVVPSGHERLQAGDVLAVAGTHESIKSAQRLLAGASAELP